MSAVIGIQIEGQEGLDWARWRTLCHDVEDLGFDSLWRSDHLMSSLSGEPGTSDALECWTSLALTAEWTRRIEFGPLVSPMTFRRPGLVAKMAAAVDNLSGGRLVLGLGAGWNEAEHTAYGVPFAPLGRRMDDFETGVDSIVALLRLERPPPVRRPLPILLGGAGERRTLRLVARAAGEWNVYGQSPEAYAAKAGILDGYCREIGRDPATIRRSLMAGFVVGRNRDDLRWRAGGLRNLVGRFQAMTPDQVLEGVRGRWLTGTPDELVAQLRPYAELGVSRFMLQHFLLDDRDALELLATEVAPALG